MSTCTVSRRSALAAAACAGAMCLGGCAASGDGRSGSGGAAAPAGDAGAAARDRTKELLERMTLEQKVAQLFIVTPEQLTGVGRATIAGDATRVALGRIPVGGLCYFSQNIIGDHQLRDMLAGTRSLACATGAGVAPFLAVDEEGGPLVARVANSGLFDVPSFPNMAEIGATGDASRAAEVGEAIGTYLRDIGFNVDFAPDADVLTNPQNTAIGPRSFGSDTDAVARMVAAEVGAMRETGVLPCVKHFPGHGDTAGDSHTGAVRAMRSREEIEACEFKPFVAAIEAGCPLVMVGHIETPNFAADGLPASLSPFMVGEVLRGELGFEGLVVSDSFSMGAITGRFSPAEAAVRFVQAGGDIVLMPESLDDAYAGVLDAVRSGAIEVERIDASVLRILDAKVAAGIL